MSKISLAVSFVKDHTGFFPSTLEEASKIKASTYIFLPSIQ